MGAILDKEEKTAEDHEMLSTLSKRSQTLELETRAAIIAEGDNKEVITATLDGEGRELESLITRSKRGRRYSTRRLAQSHTDGAITRATGTLQSWNEPRSARIDPPGLHASAFRRFRQIWHRSFNPCFRNRRLHGLA